MFDSSIREYELLSKEVSEIKACITRYIGYIIGTNGLIFLLVKFLHKDENDIELLFGYKLSLSTFLLPFMGIVILTCLYFLINYKFSSHNRHVGYLQLLSQELKHISYKSRSPIKHLVGLDGGFNKVKEDFMLFCPQNIMSWQYIMSRYNSRIREDKYNVNDFGNLDFRFALASGKSYNQLGNFFGEVNIIVSFLYEIVWKKYNRISHKHKLYNKYKTKSWRYPLHIFLISFIQIVLLTFFILLANSQKGFIFNIAWVLLIIPFWIYFGYSLISIMSGNKSIDFYCWQFLPYRVQMLNSYQIRPIFHSTLFARYFKSALIIKELKRQIDGSETFETLFSSINNKQYLARETVMNSEENFMIGYSENALVYNTILKLKLGWKLNAREKEKATKMRKKLKK